MKSRYRFPSSRLNEFSESLQQRLAGTLPGLPAQLKMLPSPRPGHQIYSEVRDTCIEAGILILFYPADNTIHLVLTRRNEKMKIHQAQISFPGGRRENAETLETAALREGEEELGIPADRVRILGCLTPLYIPPSNYCIFPTAAVLHDRPDFQPAPEEVAQIIEVPLEHLFRTDARRREDWIIRGETVSVPFFSFEGHKIWGATAMVLAELLEIVNMLPGND